VHVFKIAREVCFTAVMAARHIPLATRQSQRTSKRLIMVLSPNPVIHAHFVFEQQGVASC
jgi:hypothetical protein